RLSLRLLVPSTTGLSTLSLHDALPIYCGTIFYRIQYSVLLCMKRKGTASLTVPAAPSGREFLITVVCACRRTIVADGDNPRLFRKYGTYMLFYAVGPLG